MQNRLFHCFVAFLALSLAVAGAENPKKTVDELKIAFARDGYDVVKVVEFQGMRGIEAHHRHAFNYETKRPKKAFYVEGTGYQMGYLMGLLAHEDIEVMCVDFVDYIFFDIIKFKGDPKKIPEIMRFVKDLIALGAESIRRDLPEKYVDELNGIVEGCKEADPETKVLFKDLLVMNVGFDVLLSKFYALNNIWETHEDVPFAPEDVEIPVWCNAFSVFGKATVDGKHYFGRDFMFSTGKVFQDMACVTIHNPMDDRIPLVGVAAPGFVGYMVAMNREGIAMGVDQVPGGNCDPFRPGVNSLVMVRHAMHEGDSAKSALRTAIHTQRGVSWLYIIGDGDNDRAVTVEGGASCEKMEFPKYVPEELASLLPDQTFIDRYENQRPKKGITVRWNDYIYPQQFSHFNAELFAHHGKKYDGKSWGEKGYIDKHWKDDNCPESFYFPPQRENREDVLVMTNHYIVPSMRMCSMNPMTVLISSGHHDDIQWRYDELNRRILEAYGEIDEAKAIELIDFLAPGRDFPEYYANNQKSSDGETCVIRGSVTMCNLSDRVLHSHFGYYKDRWVTISLLNYVD